MDNLNQNNSDVIVSVTMITYNHEKYIAQAIEGVLMQKTNFRFELVLGEDCSTDRTRDICIEYRNKYPNVINLRLPQFNLGMQRNAIENFNACTGKYVAICEGDDYWTDINKLQKQVDFLENNGDYGLVWTDIDFYYQNSNTFKRGVFKNNYSKKYELFNEILINRAFIAPCTWLFRNKYSPKEVNAYCDGTFPLILDILSQSKIKYLDEITAVYRYTSISASRSNKLENIYKFGKGVFKIQKDYVEKFKLSSIIDEEINFNHYKIAFPYALIMNDKSEVEKGKLILKNYKLLDNKLRVTLILSKCIIGIILLKYLYKLKLKIFN